jgi:hypothetical protein
MVPAPCTAGIVISAGLLKMDAQIDAAANKLRLGFGKWHVGVTNSRRCCQ